MPITCVRKDEAVALGANFLKLDNGLTLIHQELPTVSVVSVDIWVSAGTAAEPKEWSGVAHFLEHMIFKGTDKVLPGEFDWLIESQGGIANAATSHDYAHFMFTTAVNNFSSTLSHLAEMLLFAGIPDDEFEQERLVVLEEMHQALDDPNWLAYQSLIQTAYGEHPYSRSVLGEEHIIENITPAQMRQYHRYHYHPEQMTVVVAGAVSVQEALASVERAFAGVANTPRVLDDYLNN